MSSAISIKAHFDGKVIVPDEPVDLPLSQALIVRIEADNGMGPPEGHSALAWLEINAIDSASLPTDLSLQHDHYLYGSPKKAE